MEELEQAIEKLLFNLSQFVINHIMKKNQNIWKC